MSRDWKRPRLTLARRRLLDRLLDRLLELDETARERELAAIGARASRVHEWLVELLAASTAPTDYLDTVFERIGQAAQRDVRDRHEMVLPQGTRIGPWRVESAVGSGGMGTVYRAVRADDAFDMVVAIKLIRLRLDSLNDRLKLERELLARLDHRNIARLIDGGTTGDGQAYLVMEWVEGRNLDEYLRVCAPAQERCIDLFARIAEAVAHAHQRQVVHGDLKPGNVRVTDSGQVRLLDFGIAQLIDGSGQAGMIEQGGMTPVFSAPEQRRGEAISTQSDIWSLGVLLVWLLGGRLPEQWSSTPAADFLPAGLERGQDLAAIVNMACREDPAQRYQSVGQLLEDLDSSRRYAPIRARAATRGYVFGRFLRRHRWPVAAGAAVSAGLVGAVIAVGWQAQIAGMERDRAQVERDRAKLEVARTRQVSDFLVDLFEHADPGVARGEPMTAEQLMENGISRARELNRQPRIQSEMYLVLGRVQLNMGDHDRARELTSAALNLTDTDPSASSLEVARVLVQLGDIRLQEGAPNESARRYRQALALIADDRSELRLEALNGLGGSLLSGGEAREEAMAILTEALDMCRQLAPASAVAASIHNNLGAGFYYGGRYAQARQHFEQAIDLLIARFGDDHPRVLFSQTNLAWLLIELARFEQAEQLLVRLVESQRKVLGADHPHRAANLHALGSVHWRQGRADQAIAWWQRSLVAKTAAYGEKHPDVASTQNALALAAVSKGEIEQAETLYQRALDTLRAPDTKTTIRLPSTISNLGDLRVVQNRMAEGEVLYREALALYQELTGGRHPHVGVAQRKLAEVRLADGDLDGAHDWVESSLETLQAVFEDPSHPELENSRALLEAIELQRVEFE